jgi:hypothetical protein
VSVGGLGCASRIADALRTDGAQVTSGTAPYHVTVETFAQAGQELADWRGKGLTVSLTGGRVMVYRGSDGLKPLPAAHALIAGQMIYFYPKLPGLVASHFGGQGAQRAEVAGPGIVDRHLDDFGLAAGGQFRFGRIGGPRRHRHRLESRNRARPPPPRSGPRRLPRRRAR